MIETLAREESASQSLSGSEQREVGTPLSPGNLALWVILATVTMLFAGFTSAYLIRRTAPDWVPVAAPGILRFSTLALLMSSAALESARAACGAGALTRARGLTLAGALLGMVFLASQIAAWRQLSANGIFLPISPHASFFYMLTGVHAVHVFGGLAAWGYVIARRWPRRGASIGDALSNTAAYWHVVTGVWIFLYVLLFVWR
jgi:cytochrome c oxidase subunit 3